MIIFAIDPGTTQSGWVLLEGAKVLDSGVHDNADLLRWVQAGQGADILAVEMIESMGMAVGKTTFDTVRWIGRFQQAWSEPDDVCFITRREVKLHLCGRMQAKDPNVRQAVLDLLGEPGTKKNPGATYGVRSHAWSALAVAITAQAKIAKVDPLFMKPPALAEVDEIDVIFR